MNYIEILEKLKSIGVTKKIFAGCFVYDDDSDDKQTELEILFRSHNIFDGKYGYDFNPNNSINIKELGEIKVLEQIGDYTSLPEGAYSMDWSIVRYFVNHNVYIKMSAYFSSYDGLDLHSCKYSEVQPVEKKIIVFEKI